jgi:uncharacterized protein
MRAFLTLTLAVAVLAGRPALCAESKNGAFIRGAFERWAAGGTRFFDEVLSPDVRWTIEGPGPVGGVYQGRADLLERAVKPLSNRLQTPIRPQVKGLWADGDHVIVHWHGSATARDGKPYRNAYVWIFQMKEGRAVAVTAMLDLAAYEDVLRRVPAPEKP